MSSRAVASRSWLVAALLGVACAGARPPSEAPKTDASSVAAPTRAVSSSSSSSLASAPPVASAPAVAVEPVPATPEVPVVDLGTFAHPLSGRVSAIALGEARVALLGESPSFGVLFEKGAWARIPLPEKLRPREGEHDEARIFFGRDDRPRLMGTRSGTGAAKNGEAQLYLRYRDGAWKSEQNEIGNLRNGPPAGMWGVLGHADPEVVCKEGGECIIKRRTGWKMMPAGPGRPRVDLHLGVAWALRKTSVARLDGDAAWTVIDAPPGTGELGGVWGSGDEVWLSEPAAGKLHHRKDGAWSTEAAPFDRPGVFWGSARTDVWLVGAGGLAHWDGARWSRVKGPEGPLVDVLGRGQEVWAVGDGGVWVRGGVRGAP